MLQLVSWELLGVEWKVLRTQRQLATIVTLLGMLCCWCVPCGTSSSQDCLNKLIYEHTILAARENIESHNPLSFAPKVILTFDSLQEGTQIQATMFNDGARKFIDVFELGKVYYISKGSLKVANKQFTTVHNDYEMTLNENSRVEEAVDEPALIPEPKFSFVPLDQLRPYLQQRALIDVIGVVQHVSSTMSIRRKVDNEAVPKRDITIVDSTMKSVVVSLWGPLATGIGEDLLGMSEAAPTVAIKSLRVSDFGGVSLSTVSKTIIQINPIIQESEKLKMWYDSEGSTASFESVGSGSSPMVKNKAPSMYSDRMTFEDITSNPCLGDEKPVYYTTHACMSLINSDQTMYYRACNACNKKVTGEDGTGYSCQSCEKTQVHCTLRYIISAKFSDATGGAWISAFGTRRRN